MKVIVTDTNDRTKNFKFDGRKLDKFIKELLQANPQGLKELRQYSHIEWSLRGVGQYMNLREIKLD